MFRGAFPHANCLNAHGKCSKNALRLQMPLRSFTSVVLRAPQHVENKLLPLVCRRVGLVGPKSRCKEPRTLTRHECKNTPHTHTHTCRTYRKHIERGTGAG